MYPRTSANITALHLVSGFGPKSFGLGYAALHLAAAADRAGGNVYLASLDQTSEAWVSCDAAGFPRQRFIPGAPILGRGTLRVAPFQVSRLSKLRDPGNTVIHLHGMWTSISWVAARLRRSWGCPLVLSPHGSLEPYALGLSARKKAIAARLYEKENILGAACMWALSPQEERDIRAWGYKGRTVVIPNGVSRGPRCTSEEITEFRTRHGIPQGHRILLYLARITPKKNLPLLLRSFKSALAAAPAWTLLIAGSDERGHLKEILMLVEDLGLAEHVRFVGKVLDREKACALSSASVFALPSHSEGLPIAVLEAMEYGKPVLVTDGWSLPVVTSARYGWRAQVELESFRDKLLQAMTAPTALLEQMGREAQEMVHAHYDWDLIGRQACALYSDLLPQHHRAMSED